MIKANIEIQNISIIPFFFLTKWLELKPQQTISLMFFPVFPVVILIYLLLIPTTAHATSLAEQWQINGHTKYQIRYTDYPPEALFTEMGYGHTTDQDIDFRVNAAKVWNNWNFNIAYQIIGIYGNSLELARQLPASPLFTGFGLVSDKTRLFDLTHVFIDEGKKALLHRLDRAVIGYTSESYVIKFGRDAISWGNGLIYNPMDFFNPFEPAAVDKDYKPGDDMLYGQWLFEGGNDFQGVLVPRRNPETGDLGSEYGSLAFKYHGFVENQEYDLLAAHHFGDNMAGVGGVSDWREAVVRGDMVVTKTDTDWVLTAVANINYTWTWGGKNVFGVLEYFFNGFGQKNSDYSPQSLSQNEDLLERLARGELFTLGRHYLAANLTYEATPLLLLTPNLFVNYEDPSALLQFVLNYDWKRNVTLLTGFNLPIGAYGTEFGGIPTTDPDVYFAAGNSIFGKISIFF